MKYVILRFSISQAKTVLLLLLLQGLIPSLIAQPFFKHSNQIPVLENGLEIDHAWGGGLNNPQFSNMDFDGDGVDDLFIFDRTNNKMIFLKHQGGSNSTDYALTFEYELNFPILKSWVLLRDFNCDGKMDIFTNETGGIRAFRNTSSGGEISFQMEDEKVQSYFEIGSDTFETSIYISIDIPAIDDIDGDGDLDIICFSQSGTTLQLFINESMELYGNCDSLDFILGNNCYAMINESAMDETITIGNEFSCSLNVNDIIREPKKPEDERSGGHVGSSICTFDSEQNGYKDVLIGDISGKNLVLINIGPSSTNLDSAFLVTTDYPVEAPVEVDYFPTGYYVDINNDGVKDLLASPSSEVESDDILCSYYYKNNGQNDLVDFELQSVEFIVDQMIDVGSGSFPHIVDYNSDGKMDLVVSNKGYYQPGGDYESQMFLYENIGTETEPIFNLVFEDYLNLSSSELGRYKFPTFGDLDGDNDLDMVVGDESGVLYFYENSAGAGQTLAYDELGVPMLGTDEIILDVGINATPQLFDLNEDGLLDLIVGERNPNINYYQNVGTEEAWAFELTNDSLGNIIIDDDGDFLGYGVPWVYYENGEMKIIIGSDKGNLYYYDELEGNIDGDFNLVSTTAFGLRSSKRSSPILYDINNDGYIDLFLGNFSGGLDLFMGNATDGISEEITQPQLFSIYPNPAAGEFNVVFEALENLEGKLEIYNFAGQLVSETKVSNHQYLSVDASDWSNGIYFVRLIGEGINSTQKLVLNH